MKLGFEGEMDSSINSVSGIVYFNKSNSNLNEISMRRIEDYLEEVVEVSNRARQLYCDIIVSPQFISKVSSNKGASSIYADVRGDNV